MTLIKLQWKLNFVTENIEMRFKAMGWEYILVEDGEDVSKIYGR